jgi:hypothetical protein
MFKAAKVKIIKNKPCHAGIKIVGLGMNKYSIQREDVGDEDRAIYVYDVYLGNQFVVSFNLESEAIEFIKIKLAAVE